MDLPTVNEFAEPSLETEYHRIMDDIDPYYHFYSTKDDVLYHYTTLDGLLGIVNSKEIWTSQINYLNDESEFLYTLQIVRRFLGDYSHRTQDKEKKKEIELLFGAVRTIEEIKICVCSFSKDGDSLAQWRAYGPQGGYAIGFHLSVLQKLAEQHHFTVCECEYDKKRQFNRVKKLIDEFFKRQRYPDSRDERESVIAYSKFKEELTKLACVLKHPAFQSEREWRLVSGNVRTEDPRFVHRAGKSMLIPYYRFPLCSNNKRLPPIDIVIGPCPNMGLAISSVNSFVVPKIDLSTGDMSIRISTIPYRNW